ncbi:MAG TPA: AmmeMemoRadiSam system protein A [Blastocatellia bacterium]|nr:AmmeMemoRadiSam system protein A [Blastocatellia bacterium]
MDLPPNNISPHGLAKLTVEAFARDRVIIRPPAEPRGVLANRAGVFVTVRSFGGQLRGCIGTIDPSCNTVAEEVIQNAISAATRDPRFQPVSFRELSGLQYGVDVLSRPEPVRGPEDLDPGVFGVIVETFDGLHRGLLLPRIVGIESVEEQWLAVHSKAGIRLGASVRVERFTVTRFGKD